MKQRIEFELPGKLNNELELLIEEEGLSKNELIKKAIENYLFVRRFRALRKKLSPGAKAQGYKTDDDIFKVVS